MVGAELQADLVHDLNPAAYVCIMRPWIAQIVGIEHIKEQEHMNADVRVIQTWNCDDWIDKPSIQEDHWVGIFSGAIRTDPQV